MSINRGDRFKLLCFIGKIDDFKKFKIAFWKQQTKRTDVKTLHKAFHRWCNGAGFKDRNEGSFLGALSDVGWPDNIPAPEELLTTEKSVPEFLDLCKLPYDQVEHLLSPEARNEWSAGHHNLHFMKALDNQSANPKAKTLLPNLIGTYRLYRRHSMLPGLLREHFVIDQLKDGHCEGTYFQFARTHHANIIPFNAYFCEFYVIAFGAHQAVGKRTEIVTVAVLVENAFSGSTLIPCDENARFYIGLLTGIYDSGNVLLAERVLIEKLSPDVEIKYTQMGGETNIEPRDWAPMHLHLDSRPEFRGEYYRVVDVIDNSLDGQTLTARLSRIELVRG